MSKECLRYNVDYLPGEKLGSGVFGDVYIELNGYGDHVMKIWFHESDENHFTIKQKKVERSLKLQNRAAKTGLSVPIIDTWGCDGKYTVAVMEKLDETLDSYMLRGHPGSTSKEVLDAIKAVLIKLHLEGVSHGDISPENLMVFSIPLHTSSVKIGKKGPWLYLIDFDMGTSIERGVDNFIYSDEMTCWGLESLLSEEYFSS